MKTKFPFALALLAAVSFASTPAWADADPDEEPAPAPEVIAPVEPAPVPEPVAVEPAPAPVVVAPAPLPVVDPKRRDALREGFFVSPMCHYSVVDSERQTENGRGCWVGVGYRWDFASLELRGEYTGLEVSNRTGNPPDVELWGTGIAALIHPLHDLWLVGDWLEPLYALVGFGAIRRENHPRFAKTDITNYIDAGAGYMLPFELLGRDWALRVEGRFRLDTQQPPFQQPEPAEGEPREFKDWIYSAGLYIPIGRRPAPPAPIAEPVAVVQVADDDLDGVTNDQDQCPGTPTGVAVDKTGCPIESKLKAGDKLVLSGVNFEFARAELTADAMTVLDGVAKDLVTQPALTVAISGHTDSQGEEAYNLDLSSRRAEAVRVYLVEKGVAAERLNAVGYGESQPVDTNDTDEGRAKNRRVELTVL